MQSAYMYYGMIDGSIDSKQSPNYDKLLSEDTRKFIFELSKKLGVGTYILKWDKEKAVSKTMIREVSDGEGRTYLSNSTAVIKYDDILQDILDLYHPFDVKT